MHEHVFVKIKREDVAALLDEGLTVGDVARRLDVALATVCYHARRLGYPPSEKYARRYDWAEIQAYYESILKSDNPIHAKNVVEHARLIQPDLLLITGIFTPDTEAGDPLNLPFVQTRQRQGDAWRIVTLQIYIFPQK